MDDLGNGLAETPPDFVKGFLSTLVLSGVVQKRTDGLILVAAMFDHDGRNADQVGDVRDRRALACLAAVQIVGVSKASSYRLVSIGNPQFRFNPSMPRVNRTRFQNASRATITSSGVGAGRASRSAKRNAFRQ